MLRRTVLAARFTTTPPTLMLRASGLALAKGAKKPQRAKAKKPPVAPPDAAPAEDPCLIEVDVPQTKCAIRPNPLDALAARINKEPARQKCFQHHFGGRFWHAIAKQDERAVLFLTGPDDLEECVKPDCAYAFDSEKHWFQPSRLSAARKVTASLRSEWDPTWSKLLVVTGPPRCGKTQLGLFGLANRRRLSIYIRTASLLQNIRESDKVSKCVAEAAVHQRIADDPTVDPWAREDAVWAARRYYKDAVVQYLLDLVKERVGVQYGCANRVSPKDLVPVIFFFDDFDRGSEGVRRAVLDTASDVLDPRRSSALSDKLKDDFGFKVHGIAVAGTRLATAEGAVQDPHTQLTVSAIGVARDDMDRVTEALLPLIQGPESLAEAAQWSKADQQTAVAAEALLRGLSSMPLFTRTPADPDDLAASLAEFLSAAAKAGFGTPLVQFVTVLNDMFSHSTQFDAGPNARAPQPVTAMRAPAGLETHTLSGYGVLTHEPPLRREVRYVRPGDEHMVLHVKRCTFTKTVDDAHATVQLVLRVGAAPEFVSFNFRCFVPSLSERASDFLKHAHAQRRAKNTPATPRSVRVATHHGGFIPVFGLRHGPCWMGDGWYVKVPGADQVE